MKPEANSARTTPGAMVMALSSETPEADAPSDEIATIGKAVRVIRLPTALTACAAHRRRKSACAASDELGGIAPFTDY